MVAASDSNLPVTEAPARRGRPTPASGVGQAAAGVRALARRALAAIVMAIAAIAGTALLNLMIHAAEALAGWRA
jgi:hypothetical protein